MKNIPNMIVKIKEIIVKFLSPKIKEWCDKVKRKPEANNIVLPNKGIDQGFIILIPWGGQKAPNSIETDKLEWKKVQKKLINNIISDN